MGGLTDPTHCLFSHRARSPTTNGATAGPASEAAVQRDGPSFDSNSVAARMQRSEEPAAQRLARQHRLLSQRVHSLSTCLTGAAAPAPGNGATAARRNDHDLAHVGAKFDHDPDLAHVRLG